MRLQGFQCILVSRLQLVSVSKMPVKMVHGETGNLRLNIADIKFVSQNFFFVEIHLIVDETTEVGVIPIFTAQETLHSISNAGWIRESRIEFMIHHVFRIFHAGMVSGHVQQVFSFTNTTVEEVQEISEVTVEADVGVFDFYGVGTETGRPT